MLLAWLPQSSSATLAHLLDKSELLCLHCVVKQLDVAAAQRGRTPAGRCGDEQAIRVACSLHACESCMAAGQGSPAPAHCCDDGLILLQAVRRNERRRWQPAQQKLHLQISIGWAENTNRCVCPAKLARCLANAGWSGRGQELCAQTQNSPVASPAPGTSALMPCCGPPLGGSARARTQAPLVPLAAIATIRNTNLQSEPGAGMDSVQDNRQGHARTCWTHKTASRLAALAAYVVFIKHC